MPILVVFMLVIAAAGGCSSDSSAGSGTRTSTKPVPNPNPTGHATATDAVQTQTAIDSDMAGAGATDGAGAMDGVGMMNDTGAAADYEPTAEDFDCILGWEQVNLMRVTNKLGARDEAVAVARSEMPGMRYPAGTIIQLIPGEAMVKHREGFSSETNDWEFLLLEATAAGTTISARGTTEIANPLVGKCVDCHSNAAEDWDFVCQKGRACEPLAFPDAVLTNLQDTDPRCN